MSELHKAFIAAQAEMPSVAADSTNPHYRSQFVSLDHLIAMTRPILNKHGLAIIQEPTATVVADTIHAGLRTTLVHTSGESRSDCLVLILAGQDMQKLGAAITYARRYAWASLLGIGEPDDDGETASRPTKRAAPKIGPNVITQVATGNATWRSEEHNPATTPTPDAAVCNSTQQEPAAQPEMGAGGGLNLTAQAMRDNPPPPQPMPPIATEGFKVASGGLQKLEQWWLTLSKSEQRQLLPYKDTLKGAAAESNAGIIDGYWSTS